MINTMVTCLGIEHRKLYGLNMQLAFAANRHAGDACTITANQKALQVWDEIRHDLWSHLQIEDALVFSWGKAQQAIPGMPLDSLKNERQQMRQLIAAMHALSPGVEREPQSAGDRMAFAQTLLALARTLDSHVERYDGEVLPSILHANLHGWHSPSV
jgi:iron-sulfur cluster repair protein YtfE (RIC family)